ncbi:hypothetical protein AA106555_1473 [Neokomagataea thailandica NBRC 106555]|uniref:Transposase n=1 Tax=Neokomagataea thailandica NBRC 106555 TaxID=1223520 RepID=A0ABQ0QR31_9PROT|nr:hypothetical protein AA106555_1473 [Neokomagataea thailandica NBRC 106555]
MAYRTMQAHMVTIMAMIIKNRPPALAQSRSAKWDLYWESGLDMFIHLSALRSSTGVHGDGTALPQEGTEYWG